MSDKKYGLFTTNLKKKKETHWAFVRIGKPWYMYIYIFMKRKFGYDSGPYNFALGQV